MRLRLSALKVVMSVVSFYPPSKPHYCEMGTIRLDPNKQATSQSELTDSKATATQSLLSKVSSSPFALARAMRIETNRLNHFPP